MYSRPVTIIRAYRHSAGEAVKSIQEQKCKLFPLLANTVLLREIRKRGLGKALIVRYLVWLALAGRDSRPLNRVATAGKSRLEVHRTGARSSSASCLAEILVMYKVGVLCCQCGYHPGSDLFPFALDVQPLMLV
jgi:hypothetical protein